MPAFLPNLMLAIVFFGLGDEKWGVINLVIAGMFLIYQTFYNK